MMWSDHRSVVPPESPSTYQTISLFSFHLLNTHLKYTNLYCWSIKMTSQNLNRQEVESRDRSPQKAGTLTGTCVEHVMSMKISIRRHPWLRFCASTPNQSHCTTGTGRNPPWYVTLIGTHTQLYTNCSGIGCSGFSKNRSTPITETNSTT